MSELLFELGCEEIPAPDLFELPEALKRIATESFTANRLEFSNLQTEVTPRRLVLRGDIEAKQKDLHEEKIGPPSKVALSSDGSPTPAGLGFAKSLGIPFNKLKVLATPKGEYMATEIIIKGQPTAKVLKQIIPTILSQLPFNKFMRWESSNFQFGRPIRRLVLLFGGKVVPFRVAGVAAGPYTFGHRFLGKDKIRVSSYEDYLKVLQENGVVLSFTDRAAKIERELKAHAEAVSGVWKEDEDLLRTMANEVEYPEVLTGSFPERFLSLPHEILINAMRKHQKYFCALDSEGRLLPLFFTVLNTHATNPDLIRKGHESVLQARLRDAEFFWKEDMKTPLASRTAQLQKLTYQEKLGTYSEKVRRMSQIAQPLLDPLQRTEMEGSLQKLIQECKTDLLTLMVGEFPELQGKMSGLHARQEGYPEAEWQALYDQYLPVSTDDPVPRNLLGALLSLTDRVEVLTSGYMLNRIPTGSRDPYGLRRVATGAIKIILEYKLRLDLENLLRHSFSLFSFQPKRSPQELLQGLLDLLETRFRFLMEQKGIQQDYMNAVLAVERNDFVTAEAKLSALWLLRSSEDLKTLARVFKRINNIIYDQPAHSFNPELLQEDGEVRLHRAFRDLEFRVQQNIDETQYQDALEIMVTLGPEIDNFFDEVLVMAEQLELRNNRIALLQQISDLYRKIADFSALQIEL